MRQIREEMEGLDWGNERRKEKNDNDNQDEINEGRISMPQPSRLATF
jgi:hypothetical protein